MKLNCDTVVSRTGVLRRKASGKRYKKYEKYRGSNNVTTFGPASDSNNV
jgi:hypothetical protein